MDHYIGKKLEGRYEIQELIGVGGMANVYKGYDVLEERTVAVKILREEFAENEEFVKRFKIESKAIGVLAHPNIVRVYDVTFTDRIQSIVMEYVDGITLKEYIEQQGVLKWKEAVHFTAQILRALQHAHDKGIIHRDIKPQNMMLQADGTIKVMDFGIARFNHSEPITANEKVIGSVHYISPEQARGELTDEKADVYSVGVMLFEMLTGTLPFEASDPVSVAMKQISDKPSMPRDINASIPEGLEDITLRAMQKDVALRYQSAAEMLRDLEAFKQNPHIQFEYKYLINESPTKFMDAINSRKPVVEDDTSSYAEKDKKKSPVLLILAAVASVLLVAVLILGYNFLQGLGGTDIPVPNLVGMEWAAVKVDPAYQDIRFIENTAFSSEYEAGVIMEQDPPAVNGSTMKSGGTMKITISKGPKEVEVPERIYLMHVDEAIRLLEQRGFNNYTIEAYPEGNNPEMDDDIVLGTDPGLGEMAPVDRQLVIYVNPPATILPVENCVGMTYEEAKDILEAEGFKVEVEYRNSSQPKDRVLAQSAVEAKKYSTITLTLSSGEEDSVDLTVSVPMPREYNGRLTFYAYVDGVPMSENGTLTCYPADRASWNLSIGGKTGSINLVIRIEGYENYPYASFTVDFDTKTVTTNWINPFPPEEEESSEIPSEVPSNPSDESDGGEVSSDDPTTSESEPVTP